MPFLWRPLSRTMPPLSRAPQTAADWTTGTLFSTALASSLLRTVVGRVLRTSPPTEGSNATHHTSPRWGGARSANPTRLVCDISDRAFRPCHRLALTRLIGCHGGITRAQILALLTCDQSQVRLSLAFTHEFHLDIFLRGRPRKRPPRNGRPLPSLCRTRDGNTAPSAQFGIS
jgi:hypothetical protein